MTKPQTTPYPETDEVAEDPNDAEIAWSKEIDQRWVDIRSGEAKTIPGEAFLEELRAWCPQQTP